VRALALLAVACALAPLCAADVFDYRKAAQKAVSDLDVQQSLPNDSNMADPPKSRSMQSMASGSESDIEVPALAAVWDQLKWVLLALMVAAILGFIASRIADRRASPQPVPASVPAAHFSPDSAPLSPEQLLAAADACAGDGRYREAMHYVLLAAMAHVGRQFREGAPDSSTSWELLRAARLQPFERTALRDLLIRSDRAWFGQYASGRADYEAARDCFQSFAGAGEIA
jgi:hypothetical protein